MLNKTRTDWKDLQWAEKINSAQKAAHRWVDAIQAMEKHREKLHIIQYENLTHNPRHEIERLANYLQVDPQYFQTDFIRSNNKGKYQNGLTPDELAQVVKIAGPTLRYLGYH